jgi:hypothetical protein
LFEVNGVLIIFRINKSKADKLFINYYTMSNFPPNQNMQHQQMYPSAGANQIQGGRPQQMGMGGRPQTDAGMQQMLQGIVN